MDMEKGFAFRVSYGGILTLNATGLTWAGLRSPRAQSRSAALLRRWAKQGHAHRGLVFSVEELGRVFLGVDTDTGFWA